jgi:hypothetical protein
LRGSAIETRKNWWAEPTENPLFQKQIICRGPGARFNDVKDFEQRNILFLSKSHSHQNPDGETLLSIKVMLLKTADYGKLTPTITARREQRLVIFAGLGIAAGKERRGAWDGIKICWWKRNFMVGMAANRSNAVEPFQ